MDGAEEVPKRVLLSGEGLEHMTPGQFATFVKNLGRMRIDVAVVPVSEGGASAELLEESETATHEGLRRFAQGTGYGDALADRVWSGLQSAYYFKREREHNRQQGEPVGSGRTQIKREQCPIEFVEPEFYIQRGMLAPVSALKKTKLSSLRKTVEWLFAEGGYDLDSFPIDKYGPRSLSFLSHYVNQTLQPEEPFEVRFEPSTKDEYAPEVIPPAEEYELDAASPYLEITAINGENVPVVSAKSIREYGKTIGIKGNRSSRLYEVFNEIAKMLVPDLPNKKGLNKPEVIANGVTYLRTNYRSAVYRTEEWGIAPATFVDMIRGAQNGEIPLQTYVGEVTRFVITHYINAIRANRPDAADSAIPAE